MNQPQRDLFGTPAPKPSAKAKAKAKALPKAAPVTPASKQTLSSGQRGQATKNLNRVTDARDALPIGHLRLSDRGCPECDGQQLEILEGRRADGGLDWSCYCLNRLCARCPDHGLEMTCNK
jgi:hypothetical protein